MACAVALPLGPLFAEEAPKPLLDLKAGGKGRLSPSSPQVTVARSKNAPGVVVTIQPGNEGYPGVSLPPEAGVWDLSKFGHVEARVVNTGEKPLALALRVDNAGDWQDSPYNTENVFLDPGDAFRACREPGGGDGTGGDRPPARTRRERRNRDLLHPGAALDRHPKFGPLGSESDRRDRHVIHERCRVGGHAVCR